MEKITKADILGSEFVTSKDNDIEYIQPDAEYFKKCSYRNLCVHIAITGLRFRTLEKSLKNANQWLAEKNDKELRNLFLNN